MLNMNVPFILGFLTLDLQEEVEMVQGIFCTQLFMLVYLVKICLILVAVILVKKCLLQQSLPG